MATAPPKNSAFVSGEEPGRQIQYQDSHNNNQEHAPDGPSKLTEDSINCTKTTQHLSASEPRERQNRVTEIRQELLASEDEFIELKTEFSICKHVLEERLTELRNIAGSAKEELIKLKSSLDFQIQAAKRHIERQKELQVSVEGEDEELRRDSEKCKQATKERLEELNQLRVFVERDTEDLRKDFERSKQAAKEELEELNRLRVFVERDKKELQKDYERSKQATKELLEELNQLRDYVGRCKDELRENLAMSKQAAEEDIEELRKPRDIYKKERHKSGENLQMDSRKRPLFARLKGVLGKTSRRRKKKPTTEEASHINPTFEETDVLVTTRTNVDVPRGPRDLKSSYQAAREKLEDRYRSRGRRLSLKDEYFTSDFEADSDSDFGRPPERSDSLYKSKLKTPSLSADSDAGFSGAFGSTYGYLTDTEQYNRSRCSSHSGTSFFLSSARGSISSHTRRRTGRSRFYEDDEEITEPIRIVRQPKSQKIQEGSRAEFHFKVQEQDDLMYQWLKDNEQLAGQNNDTLVLDCIELYDFGCYTCQVSYQGDNGVWVKSRPAKLDVVPVESRNGTRPKLLQEVDLHTRDEVAYMLENNVYGLGGWRQVATEYAMEERKIKGLYNSREPGKDVMEFLGGSQPNLTVYEFCKFLKHRKIRRFDIVKLLEDHFLVEDGAG